jgi:hypothetical protein
LCGIIALLAAPAFAVLEQRAQSWQPQRLQGSARLPVEAIEFIVLPTGRPDGLRSAADDLVRLLQPGSGGPPEILREEQLAGARPKNALYFECVPSELELGGAFTIRRERTRVTIRSADGVGWVNGLYAIAESLLGARWYWSGELGFERVEPERADFPNRPWRESPAFVQRRFYPSNTDYARRNRLNRIYDFNHNLARVFSPELFQTNPEVFAERNGRRKPPEGSAGTDPQPDFTNPEASRIAARAALDHFRTNPESTSFSLSINDNAHFDTAPATEAAVSPLRYFRGRPDYTDLVFGFMNRVAEEVFEAGGAWQTPSGKDRYLTALAYYWTEGAPTIPVHPRVMPVLTSDRAQWHDPAYREADKALIEAWVAAGPARVATWDYYFGAPYPYPRQFNQWIAESLRFMADAGVDVFFSQLPAFWGLDGAKPWLGAQLLWDPYQDADALLDEYYTEFFGPAAEPMRRFYTRAEGHRNAAEGPAEWIKLYKDESGIALFTPEVLQAMRDSLDEAAASLTGVENDATATDFGLSPGRYAERVEVVSSAFRLSEYYAAMDRARQALVIACFDDAAESELVTRLAAFREARGRYGAYFETYFAGAEYAPARRHLELPQSNPEGLAEARIHGLSERATRSLVDAPELRHRGYAERNFLGPLIPKLDGWNIDYRPSQHLSVEASARSGGAAGLRIQGVDILSLFRTYPVVSNEDYRLRIDASWQVSLDNRIQLHLNWLDREGNLLASQIPLHWPIEERHEPVTIELPLRAPNNAYDLRVRLITSRQGRGDYLDISQIDFAVVLD